MLLFPILFFGILFFNSLKRNGLGVSTCMLTMYLITSVFGLILGNTDYQFEYENYSTIEIGIIPVLVYSLMIWACIYPFYKTNNKTNQIAIIKNQSLFKNLVGLYIFILLVLIAAYAAMIVFIITYGDFGALRKMVYEGILQDPIYSLSGPFRAVASVCSILGEGAYFMIAFFFYSVCALNNKTWFNLLILLSSLSPVLIGFVNIDRSKMVFWFLIFIMTYCLYRPHISTPYQKRFIRRIASFFLGLIVVYLALVTISRFGERDSGTEGGLLVYIGQPIINFCNIWDNLWTDNITTVRVLPITNFILGQKPLDSDYVATVFAQHGVHINVFTSFVGVFLIDIGHLGAILIPLFISFVTSLFLRSYKNSLTLTLRMSIIIVGIGTIVQCGIIGYYYITVGRVFTFFMFLFLSRCFGCSGVKNTTISR